MKSRRKHSAEATDDLEEWPWTLYVIKGDYIEVVRRVFRRPDRGPDSRIGKPLPPLGSPQRAYEIYKIALQCLAENLQGRLVTPHEYKKLFEALRLDDLSLEVMTINGVVRGICLVCHKDLRGAQKKYCSKLCQNTAKQRRRLADGRKAVR